MKVKLIGMGVIVPLILSGNNIRVSQVELESGGPSYVYVKFDLAWENSWRDAINWDAAWVFVKYRMKDSTSWHHAYLAVNDGDHVMPQGFTCDVGTTMVDGAARGIGVFIYREEQGVGDVELQDVKLRWNYGENGLTADDKVWVKVFAIEMVYIPEGGFWIGDDATDPQYGAFRRRSEGGPVFIDTSMSDTVVVGATQYDDELLKTYGIRIDGDDGIDTTLDGIVDNDAFPTGYKAFYCMKYEISQGAYRDFLNTLTEVQASNRFMNSFNTTVRHYITVDTVETGYVYGCNRDEDDTLDEVNDGEWVACNCMSWADLCAFADWAGLRPMSELEFEKICRGENAVVDDEFSWGDTVITKFTCLYNPGEADEVPDMGNANYKDCDNTPEPRGPIRCGAFAAIASNRREAGASYYGVMEMSGNLWERCVTLGKSKGRQFRGTHGDGELDENGYATNGDWPDTTAVGAGFRGGSYYAYDEVDWMRVANRRLAAAANSTRNPRWGGRCVRTAP